MHIQIYKTRPDIYAVCHTHSMYASSFAVVGKPIPAVVYESLILNLKDAMVPVAPYGLPGSTELSERIIEAILRSDAILMEKHGALTVDQDPYEAVLKSAYLEEMAEIYYHALVINGGKEPASFSSEELQRWKYPSEVKMKKN